MTKVSKSFSQHRRVPHDILLAGSGASHLRLCFVALEIDDLKHFPSSSTRKGPSRIVFTSSGIAARREKIDLQNEHEIGHTKVHKNGCWYLRLSWRFLDTLAKQTGKIKQEGLNCAGQSELRNQHRQIHLNSFCLQKPAAVSSNCSLKLCICLPRPSVQN